MNPLAHGIGNVQDLPIPAWMFYWGAGLVLVVSFVLLGALWKQSLLAAHERGRDLGAALSRFVVGRCGSSFQAISVVLFGLVWASALFGDTDPYRNLAPTWIYVVLWLGVPALSVLLGNVWRALSPRPGSTRLNIGVLAPNCPSRRPGRLGASTFREGAWELSLTRGYPSTFHLPTPCSPAGVLLGGKGR